jgi:hypothetical protein
MDQQRTNVTIETRRAVPVTRTTRRIAGYLRFVRFVQFARWLRMLRGERLAVAALLFVAMLLRLTLAARGWPQLDSDEGIVGLMTSDILARSHVPIFYYGQSYMGAILAYLSAPAFILLGATNFSLRVTVTVEIVAFLLVLYLFTRTIYSRRVALCTLALLALGPTSALYHEFYARAGNQTTLLLGTLILWLTVLRLQHADSARATRWIDIAIGLAAGVALWVDFLILPFLVAAGAALTVDAFRRRRRSGRSSDVAAQPALPRQLLTTGAACVVGMAPLIVSNVASDGRTFYQILVTGGAPGYAQGLEHITLLEHVRLLGLQLVSVLLIGLPRALGNGPVCGSCALWPNPSAHAADAGQIGLEVLFALPFSLLAIGLWAIAALPLARDVARAVRSGRGGAPAGTRAATAVMPSDPRWWGRAMLVGVAGLAFLMYVVSAESYRNPITSSRYLVALYACAPLAVAPLLSGAERVWAWLRAVIRRQSHGERPAALAYAATAVLLAAFFGAAVEAGTTLATTRDATIYGVPYGTRDAHLIAFMQAHQATRFYAPYWTCYRIAFEAHAQFVCIVTRDDDAFNLGQNRVVAYMTQVAQTPHPAYIFDPISTPASSAAVAQVAAHIAQGDPAFAGYTSASVDGFVVYYHDT